MSVFRGCYLGSKLCVLDVLSGPRPPSGQSWDMVVCARTGTRTHTRTPHTTWSSRSPQPCFHSSLARPLSYPSPYPSLPPPPTLGSVAPSPHGRFT